MDQRMIKVVLIGPECTGKTTLCEQLASHYGTISVGEYARHYLEKNGKAYTQKDLLAIAKGQIENEEKALQQLSLNTQYQTPKNFLFIDTNMLVIKVWSEIAFNSCDSYILNHISARVYDFYVLCEPDFQWQKDDLRESPDLSARKKIYHHYKDTLVQQSTPWISIGGDASSRLKLVVEKIDALFQ